VSTKTAGPCAAFPAASCADSSQTACQCAGRAAAGSPRRALGGCARHRAGNGRRDQSGKTPQSNARDHGSICDETCAEHRRNSNAKRFSGVMNSRRWSYLPSGLPFSLRPGASRGCLAEGLGSGWSSQSTRAIAIGSIAAFIHHCASLPDLWSSR
jgi:hypothetical protein